MKIDPEVTAEANLNWGKAVADSFAKLGIFDVFFSPGSRSTPLILGFERNTNFSTYPVLDERSAAFIALGFSKRTSKPTILVCTSGSALTHWFPAVVEASHSGIPLFLLSADRPPELQNCGAGQTINQINLFGSFVRSFHQICLPELKTKPVNKLINSINEAFLNCLGQNPGPVHLNFPFREPFLSSKTETFIDLDYPKLNTKFFAPDKNQYAQEIKSISNEITNSNKPIIIAGEFAQPDHLLKWLNNYSIPVFCDSLSPLRNINFKNRILRYENLLRDKAFINNHTPDLVIILGPLPTSKTLRQWIDKSGSKRIIIEPRGINVDPLNSPSSKYSLPYEYLEKLIFRKVDPNWANKWTSKEQIISSILFTTLSEELPDFEGKLSYLLSLHIPINCQLHVANSMPIRDVEWFWNAGDKRIRLYGNRGVNGIDGTVGTAIGIAHKSCVPTFLLTGELGFLHDSNALLFSKQFEGSLNIFLINNKGGGIFENLNVVEQPEFEKCFATPQDCNFENLCLAHKVDFKQPKNWNEVVTLIQNPIKQGIRIIELKTDRKSDKEMRQKLLSIRA